MIGAMVKDDLVVNLIVIAEANVAEMAAALQCEIIDAAPHGLQIGDLRTAAGWTRNAGGEQMLLPLLEQEQYDSYSVQQKKIVELEETIETTSEATAGEALAILNGEVSE